MQLWSFWVPSFDLRHLERAALERRGSMLTDQHMYAVNKLLSQQYPHLQGLHSTLLTQSSSGFPPIEMGGGFVADGKQIIIEFTCRD